MTDFHTKQSRSFKRTTRLGNSGGYSTLTHFEEVSLRSFKTQAVRNSRAQNAQNRNHTAAAVDRSRSMKRSRSSRFTTVALPLVDLRRHRAV